MISGILQEMTIDQVREFRAEVVVLGVASTEPHGPILPYGTDFYQCDALCRGAVELAITLAAQAMGYLPAIRNLEHPCAPGIDFVREGRETNGRVFLVENFGFGGQNAALVVKR